MDVFRTDRIRNVVLLGHGGAGKTTLAEAMAYLAGLTNRLGRVEDGNTVSDYDKEEIKRHFSITTSVIPVPWQKNKVNILDTPGYFDFVGEVEEAVSAADAAIIVVSGKAGVQVGTQKAWNLCEKYKLPRMIFVTDMDVDDVSYRKVVDQLTELYGKKIAPLHFPIREDGKFVGYVNVVKQAGRKYIDKGQKEECEIPSYLERPARNSWIVILREMSSPLQKFPQHLPPMYRMQALFRYAWDPRSIFAAYPTFWTTSADISQARTNVPATVFPRRPTRFLKQITISPKQNQHMCGNPSWIHSLASIP